MVNAQEWLDSNYSNKETTTKIKRKHFTEILEGELVIGNFPNLQKIDVSSFRKGKLTKLKIVNCPQLRKLNCENNQLEKLEIDEISRQQLERVIGFNWNLKIIAQEWLDKNYPKEGVCIEEYEPNFGKKRSEITKLDISGYKLEGNLNCNDFPNLKKLDCCNTKLTSLDLSNCEKLEELDCSGSQLTNLSLPRHRLNLTKLDINNNNFSNLDLSIFSFFPNLEVLKIGNCAGDYFYNIDEKIRTQINQGIYNRFSGSLEPLWNLTKLWKLDISNTDINEVDMDKLPRSLKIIKYSTNYRPDCELTEIVPLLDKYYKARIKCQ